MCLGLSCIPFREAGGNLLFQAAVGADGRFEVMGGSHTVSYTVKGEYIISPIYLYVSGANSSSFDITPTQLYPEEVCGAGATFFVNFHPQEYGFHEAQLTLQCGDLPDDIIVQLRGLCMPVEPAVVSVDNLKASYSKTSPDILLALRNNNEAVTWYIDNNPLADNTFSPSSLSAGTHTIRFKTAHITGQVRVVITE